jgi:type IV secretion system protein TrbL
MTCVLSPGCVVSSVLGDAASGFMGQIANAFAASADKAVQYLVAGWTQIPSPGVSGGAATWLQGQLQPLVILVGALSIIAAMALAIWTARAEPAKQMVAGLLRLVVVSGAGLAAIDVLLKIGDAFSANILGAATPQGGNFANLAILGGGAIAASTAPALLIILGLIVILSSVVQLFLLVARGGLVVVLGGTWPLSAAASGTPAGNAWFRKTTAWLIAFIAFKPTAAIVYAAALRMTLSGDGGLQLIEGVMLLAMAVLALPALMRMAVPAVAAVGGVSAGKVAAGAAILATGAIATIATGGAAAPAAAQAASGALTNAGGEGPLSNQAPPTGPAPAAQGPSGPAGPAGAPTQGPPPAQSPSP